jgi:hypothetical protein
VLVEGLEPRAVSGLDPRRALPLVRTKAMPTLPVGLAVAGRDCHTAVLVQTRSMGNNADQEDG